MALLSDYTSGTLTVATNGTAVTGSGTAWLAAGFQEGDLLVANGYFGIVGSVESNTALTLAQPWRGGDLTASAYRLRYQGDGSRISAQARQLIELLGVSGNLESLADITGTANSLPYFTGVGQMALTSLTPFARTLLDDASASTALTTLGVSTFIKTLLDDTDQATARTTLGAASSADLTSGLAGKYPNDSGIANAAAIATNTANIAANTANIASNATAIAAKADASTTVSVAGSQSLTAAQKQQARANIAVGVGALRNKILNPLFSVNQRAVSGTVTLAAGAYGHDMMRAGSSGCTYTFSTNNGVTILNITAGSIQQVIEANKFSGDAGTYFLSWSGTAQGRINSGAYGASGTISVTCDGSANVVLEFNIGTVSLVQFERGYVSDFSGLRPNELALCQSYYFSSNASVFAIAIDLTGTVSDVRTKFVHFYLPVTMRQTPSVTVGSGWSASATPNVISASIVAAQNVSSANSVWRASAEITT
jgi:hypothetical protein